MSDPSGPSAGAPPAPAMGSPALPDRLQGLADGLTGGAKSSRTSPLVRLLWVVLLLAASVPGVIFLVMAYRERLAGEGLSAASYPAFYPLYGLVACLVVILLARIFAVALARKDTFYDAE